LKEKEREKRDIFEQIWKFFASVKLAIFVFIILAVSSIIGTIVEQQAAPEKNIALLAKFFGDEVAPTVYNIFVKLGFMDMYRSWWYTSFLVLFCINLIVCSLERLPKTWQFINRPLKPMPDSALRSLPIKKEYSLKATLNGARDAFVKILNEKRYRFQMVSNDDGSIQLFSQKGKYARLGAYFVHISIIMIFIGAIIGARFGFSGYLNLPEGGSSSFAYKSPTEKIPLGFTIKCNWYNTEYYKDTMTPKEFQSELVIIEDGREVMKKVIEVNDPLVYKGITFYQSSYGVLRGVLDEFTAPRDPNDQRMNTLKPIFSKFPNSYGRFIIKVITPDGQSHTLWLKRGDTFEIPGTGIRGTIVGFSPALDRDRRTGELGTSIYFKDTIVNPAVAIEISAPGRDKFIAWFLRGERVLILPEMDHEIEFVDFRGIEYTGLQVAKDPGVWLIYVACIIMGVALYVTFFISHKKIWINIASAKNSVRVTIGGTSNRNRLGFEREIEGMISKIKDSLEGRT